MADFLLAILVFLMPLSSVRRLIIPVGAGLQLSPVKILEIVLLYLSLLSWSVIARKGGAGGVTKQTKLLMLLLLLWAGESMISIFWLDVSVYGYDYRRPLNFLEYFVLIALFLLSTSRERTLSWALCAFVLSSCASLGLNFLESLGWINLPGMSRQAILQLGPFRFGSLALFDSADGYAAWTLPLLPAVIVAVTTGAFTRSVRALLLLSIPVVAVGGALNGSRATWIAGAASLPITLYVTERFSVGVSAVGKIRRSVYAAAFLAGLYLLVNYGRDLWDALVVIRRGTVYARMAGYQLGLRLSLLNLHYFLFGAGKERFLQELGTKAVPHNALIEELAADGIVGLGLLLIVFYLVFRMAIQNIGYFQVSNRPGLYRLSLFSCSALATLFVEGLFANITPAYGVWIMVAFIVTAHNIAFAPGKRADALIVRQE